MHGFGTAVLLAVAMVRRDPGQSNEALAKRLLPPGRQLAHTVVQGDFGPGPRSIAAFHQNPDSTDSNFGGFVLAGGPVEYRKFDLPKLDLIPGHFEIEIVAVAFANANREPGNELLVLYSYHRNGSTSDDSHGVSAYAWNGAGFASLPVAGKLAGLSKIAAVKRRLKELGY